MRLILGTHSENPDYNADCDYALVEITPKYAREILERVTLTNKLSTKDGGLCCTMFSDCSPSFFAYCDETDGLTASNSVLDEVWDCGDIKIPDEEFQRTESDKLVIWAALDPSKPDNTILFKARPKYSDFEISTAYLSIALLTKIAADSLIPDSATPHAEGKASVPPLTDKQQAECIALVRQIANFNKDGEMLQVPDDPEEQYEFQETIEDIEATLHDVIDQARSILNVPAPR